MIQIENSHKNRKELFTENLVPNLEKYGFSYIFGNNVHIDTLYDAGAEGKTEEGKWWSYSKSFGIEFQDSTLNICERKISEAESKIPYEERVEEFIDTHKKGELYLVDDFFNWTRRLTGACFNGRLGFIKSKNLDFRDKCNVSYFLEVAKREAPLPNKIFEYYKDETPIYEKYKEE